MAAFSGGANTVKIIPASAMRDQQFWYDPYVVEEPHSSYPAPINAAYYMGGVYNASSAGGYLHEPYGQHAYIDQYGDQSYPYYSTYNMPPYQYQQQQQPYPGAYGPYPNASGAYRPYPQPQPSPTRRSRTAPSRTMGRTPTVHPTDQRRTSRGFSADPYDRRPPTAQQYKAYNSKKSMPMYKKRREPTQRSTNMQETSFGGGPVDYGFQGRYFTDQQSQQQQQQQPQTLRRMRPFYAPSYTTYPPSTMHKTNTKKLDSKRYPLYARVILKVAQLTLSAAILGLVLGPMRGSSFHEFVIRTNTEWQGLVVGIVSCWGILTVILLFTCFLANYVHAWRKLDAHVTLIGIIAYLLVSCLEAYYAACYPPNGPRINLVCHRAEWIIATILCFINMALYVIDFILSWFSGVTML